MLTSVQKGARPDCAGIDRGRCRHVTVAVGYATPPHPSGGGTWGTAGAARILCIVPKSRAFSHMRRRSASKAAEAVPLDQLTGANGACSSCVGTPIACTLEHASATRARRGVTARAKKKRSVCVFT